MNGVREKGDKIGEGRKKGETKQSDELKDKEGKRKCEGFVLDGHDGLEGKEQGGRKWNGI